ncbi:NADH-quinone oxidoreductase subunit NuoN [Cellulomonas fimi]|uniref:NADH-quinone oxidoreductase subunit N n=1 Tax=Cellulomonas fimi (strain ATCC 484 / DSM 20113 / JCM 1341 / CCUG 24087 / LMG 16345 / NBRC 15513 / NCIMB 8980 / NCTC 7547 / NRS-133) TaxID=590998 RepID=F4H1B2_CELFA|nr:NADH-quinone oxidoreductase subunit NuoN [Cellulomonas fimi]AEE45083.1 proton-translocating NADH-quinone oxidoreductase, chain N [Cellulomonas fimi ATCC 484]NNH08773.1 NADH-quinone oxidoreductase subunit NuoN [Cellulomonas fimi]VEH28185.1 NADH-quinone oxidoreductase subunit N [Cellulomonas fimi]
MNEFTAPDVPWTLLSPALIVLLAAVVGVLVEAFVPARVRRTVQVSLALGSTAAALVAVAALWQGVSADGGTAVLGGSLVVDGPTLVLQGTIALLALLSILVVADRTDTGEDAFAPSAAAVPGSDYEEVARRRGLQQTEVYPLLLFAVGGMLVFPAAGDLLTLFVALEVLSLPLYLLTGMARRRRLLSQEAAMKYFLLGAFASALMLFGIGLVYGYSGSLRYSEIAEQTLQVSGADTVLLVGSVLVLSGLLFKVGAVPFHTWTPDVYQGAPTPITGFMAACTKVAAFGALLRLVYVVLPELEWDLSVVLWAVAIATMVVGTVAALVQTDIKRVLAYSSIAHAGFILTGVVALDSSAIPAVLFYLLVYGAGTVGAFGIVWLVRERAAGTDDEPGPVLGEATRLSQWAGLGRSHPVLAVTFALFLLSFAGIPLTAGFIGKFAVFSAAVEGGAWPLAVVGVLSSAAAAFFYVRIIVLMFFGGAPGDGTHDGAEHVGAATAAGPDEAAEVGLADSSAAPAGVPAPATGAATATLVEARTATTTTVVGSEGFALVAIAVCAVVTVLLGVLPSPVLDLVTEVSQLLP